MHWLIVVGQLGSMTAAAAMHSGNLVQQNCAGRLQLAVAAASSGEAAAVAAALVDFVGHCSIEIDVGDQVEVTDM